MNDRIIVLGTLNERVMKGSLAQRGLKGRLYDVVAVAVVGRNFMNIPGGVGHRVTT